MLINQPATLDRKKPWYLHVLMDAEFTIPYLLILIAYIKFSDF